MDHMPVALLHAYNHNPINPYLPGIREYEQIQAAELLYAHKHISAVVITAGRLNATQPSLSEVIKNELLKRNVIPKTNIYVFSDNQTEGRSTHEEVQLFKKAADHYKWTHFASIGQETHIPRIKTELKRAFHRTIPVFSTEETIETYIPSQREAIQKKRVSSDEQAFRKIEKVVNVINDIPVIGTLLLSILTKLLRNKGRMQESVRSWIT